ncbi:unnamed protein product, partial [Medioppia subpectinata]
YCPHLGANLGVGGHVVTESESGDDCIQCPFHGWRFGGDGQCKHIPNLEKSELIALKARVKRWRVMERNDMIYVWHHTSDAEPDHCLPDLSKKYNIPNLTVLSKYTYKLYTSSQQVMENLIDIEHNDYVHAHFIRGVLSTKFIITGDGTEDSPMVVFIELFLFNSKVTTMHLEQRACTPAYAESHIKYIGIPGVTPAMLILSAISLAPERMLFNTRFLGTPTLWNQISLHCSRQRRSHHSIQHLNRSQHSLVANSGTTGNELGCISYRVFSTQPYDRQSGQTVGSIGDTLAFPIWSSQCLALAFTDTQSIANRLFIARPYLWRSSLHTLRRHRWSTRFPIWLSGHHMANITRQLAPSAHGGTDSRNRCCLGTNATPFKPNAINSHAIHTTLYSL